MALHSLDVEQLRRLSLCTPAAHFEAPLGLPFETLPRYTPLDVAPSLSELPAPVSPRPYDDTLRKREFIASIRSPAPTALTVSAQLPPRLGLEITPLNFAQRQLPPPIPPPPPQAASAASAPPAATPPTPYLTVPATAVPVTLHTRPQPPPPRPRPQSPAAASASAFAAAAAAAAAPAAFGGGGLSVDERVQRILAAVEERERLLFEAEQPAVAPRYVPPPQAPPPRVQPAAQEPSPTPSPPPRRWPTPPEPSPSPSPQARTETPAHTQPAREAAGNTIVIPAGLPRQPLGLEFAQELPLILRAVRPGSPADTSGAGAYAGRTLLSIDGAAVQTVEDVRRAGGSGAGVVVLTFSEEAAVPTGGGGQQRRTYFAPVPETEASEMAAGPSLLAAAEESARLRVVDGESIAFMSLLGSSGAPASPVPAVVEADNPIAHLVDSDPSRWVRLQRGDEIVWVKR